MVFFDYVAIVAIGTISNKLLASGHVAITQDKSFVLYLVVLSP